MSKERSETQARNRSSNKTQKGADLHLIETNDEQSLLIDNLRAWAESVISPHTQHWDEEQELPAKVLREAEDLGLYAIAVQERHGGFDMGYEAAIAAVAYCAPYQNASIIGDCGSAMADRPQNSDHHSAAAFAIWPAALPVSV